MVVEKFYVGEAFVRYGRILYAEYEREDRNTRLPILSRPGKGRLLHTSGESLRKAFCGLR